MISKWNREMLLPYLMNAGGAARQYQEEAKISMKSDKTLVTNLDIAVEGYLKEALAHIDPEAYFIGEESIKEQDEQYIQAAFKKRCWIVDPIDGTAPFTYGFDTWAISIGYMIEGRLVQGALYAPCQNALIISEGDTVYVSEDAAPIVDGTDESEMSIMSPMSLLPLETQRSRYKPHGVISISQDIARYGKLDTTHSVQSIGSCVYSVVQYLMGRYSSVITHVKLWDIAGAIPLLKKMGHTILLADGSAVKNRTTAFLVQSQQNPNKRWGMPSHIFIDKNRARCQHLIDATTYPYPART